MIVLFFYLNCVFTVVWIAAVIAISILGLVVGVLFGGPTTCLSEQRSGASRTTTITATTNNAGTEPTSPVKKSSAADAEQSSTKNRRAFELIATDKYTTFDIHKQQEQVSGSQDTRNSTCKPDHTVPVS